MPPAKQWDEEDSDSSTPPSSPPNKAAVGRRQFDDEEDDDDVLDSWDAAEDSDVEREKAKKAAEAKAKVDAAAAANKKSKKERIAEHQAERARIAAESDSEEEEEDEAIRRARLRRTEKESDMRHAEDLFGEIGVPSGRTATNPGAAVVLDAKEPNNTVNLNTIPVFNPQTKLQFEKLRQTLVPVLSANAKKGHYTLFLEEFAKDLAKELPSDQIKKIASSLTRAGNEKMKEEKAADKSGKKTKAAKTKTSLVTSRANAAELDTYENDGFGDDDFM